MSSKRNFNGCVTFFTRLMLILLKEIAIDDSISFQRAVYMREIGWLRKILPLCWCFVPVLNLCSYIYIIRGTYIWKLEVSPYIGVTAHFFSVYEKAIFTKQDTAFLR